MYSYFLAGAPRCAGSGAQSNRLRRFPRPSSVDVRLVRLPPQDFGGLASGHF